MGEKHAADDYITRLYRPGDEEGILNTFNQVFGDGIGIADYQPRTMEHWRWQYLDCPESNQIALAENSSGEIVAQFAGIPYRANFRGRIVIIWQGVDTMSRQDYRRGHKSKGAFLDTADLYFNTWCIPTQNFFGHGILAKDKAHYPIGLKYFHYLPLFQDIPTIYRRVDQNPDDIEVLASTGTNEENSIHINRIKPIHCFGHETDDLWRRLVDADEMPMAVIRDARYLNWRYIKCPIVDYQAYGYWNDSKLEGVMVLCLNWQKIPKIGVFELLVPLDRPDIFVGLLYKVCQVARHHRLAGVELWLPPHHPHFGLATKSGFTSQATTFTIVFKECQQVDFDPDWIQKNMYWSLGDYDLY